MVVALLSDPAALSSEWRQFARIPLRQSLKMASDSELVGARET
jgi:hypothetical protein